MMEKQKKIQIWDNVFKHYNLAELTMNRYPLYPASPPFKKYFFFLMVCCGLTSLSN